MMAGIRKLPGFFLRGDIQQTVKRFPLSVACCGALFLFVILNNHKILSHDIPEQIYALLGIGFFWFGGAQLVRESKGWHAGRFLTLSFSVFAALAALLFITDHWQLSLCFLSPAALLFIMIAPYLSRAQDDETFWRFNQITWSGAAAAFIAALILQMGLMAVIGSITYLFEIEFPDKLVADIFAFCAILFAPLYALSWVPRQFDVRAGGYIKALYFIVNWVLVPLIFTCFVVLYAYFAKILIEGELPRGNLAYMVMGFGCGGIVTYLLAAPLKDLEQTSHKIRLFQRSFFPALLVPVGMLFVSIGVRIAEYGVTEQRYAVVAAAVWLALVCALFVVFRRKMPIKAIPGILIILLLLSSFGPWGAVSVSGESQMARLKALLEKHDILRQGRIVPVVEEIPFADEKNISSIIDYLKKTDRTGEMKNWFAAPSENWESLSAPEILEKMGLSFIGRWQNEGDSQHINLYSPVDSGKIFRIGGFNYMIPGQEIYVGSGPWHKNYQPVHSGKAVQARLENGLLSVSAGNRELVFDLAAYALEKADEASGNQPVEMMLERSVPGLTGRLFLRQLSGEKKGESVKINHVYFILLLKIS